jgi:hypothetical protein
MCRLSWNLGASTSWNPLDLSRPVMGLFYLYLSVELIAVMLFWEWYLTNAKTLGRMRSILILQHAVNMWVIATCLKGLGLVRNLWVLIVQLSFVYGLEEFWSFYDSARCNESGVHAATKHSLQTLGTVPVFRSDRIRSPCGAWRLLFVRIRYGAKWNVRLLRCSVVLHIQAPWNSSWTVKIEITLQDMHGLTTGPKPLPKRFLHIVRSRASSFKWEYLSCP